MSKKPSGLRRRVQLRAPAKRAFAAFGALAGPRGWWTPLASGSTKAGGVLTLRFRGLEESIRFRVEACEPRSATWRCLKHDSLEEWAGTKLHFSIDDQGAKASSLELLHEGLVPTLDCYSSCRAGWEHFLSSLASWVETGHGEPFGKAPARSRKKAAASAPAAASESDAHTGAAFSALARRFADQPRVTLPADKRGKFGSNALKVDGKIFAMLVRGNLAVKLSRAEVESATRAGRGEPLSMGRGRMMKEWLVVKEPPQRWYALTERARAFVAGEHVIG